MLRVREGVLVLETLLWPDEVRETEFPFLDDDIDVRPQELRMASSLIESMTVDFDPDEYHDNYREALQEVVAAKIEGREILQPEPGAEAGRPAIEPGGRAAGQPGGGQGRRQAQHRRC